MAYVGGGGTLCNVTKTIMSKSPLTWAMKIVVSINIKFLDLQPFQNDNDN